jgi:flagellar basal-body rod modification protein FlgD
MSNITTNADLFGDLGLTTNSQQQTSSNQLQLEDFMNLMITELTHQDPFKPMENTELATQISQFATVSGIDDLNTSFDDLRSTLTSDQALQASNLVGREVMINSNLGWFSGTGNLSGSIELPSTASNVVLRVTDTTGALVREIQLGSSEEGSLSFSWDGSNDAGEFMPAGQYHLSATASVDGVEMAPDLMVAAQVESVSLGGSDGVQLNLTGLGQVHINNVASIQ